MSLERNHELTDMTAIHLTYEVAGSQERHLYRAGCPTAEIPNEEAFE